MMERDKLLSSARRLVVKLGSNILAPEGNEIRTERLHALAGQVASLKSAGRQVILVSSGAIASGMRMLSLSRRPSAVEEKQALAAIGQPELMRGYAEAFSRHGVMVAQVLLTADDMLVRSRYLNARRSLRALLDKGVVPIINENDAVAVDEIRMGDNDTLSALVTMLCEADLLVILSDTDGLYSGDPRKSKGAALVSVVEAVTAEVKRWAGNSPGSAVGSGGMATKIRAAEMVTKAGHAVLLASGLEKDVLQRAMSGETLGTLFLPLGEKMSSRKRWLAFGTRTKGVIRVDSGARTALISKGKSLLPKGIISVIGAFKRGDAVSLQDAEGAEFARGTSAYSSEDLARIQGRAGGEIQRVLGYTHGDEAVHRDNLVLTRKD